MTVELRDYQDEMIRRARVSLRLHRSILLQAPTGAGKTALSARMIGTSASKGLSSLFICHRAELIEQTSKTFETFGIPHGFCAAGYPFNPYSKILVCSIDTLKNRLDRIGERAFLVWDEAHHTAAAGWRRVREAFSVAYNVGLSATPERLDGKGLDDLFDDLIPGPSVASLIQRGYLAPYKAFAPSTPNLSGIRKSMGDFARGDLEEVMDGSTIIGDAVRHYQRHARGKRAVVFCVSIKHSEHVAAQFQAAGIVAVSLDGKTDALNRKRALDAFRRGDIQILCNVDLFGEGFDLPSIEAVIMLRPTHSLALYLQQVGRSLRPAPGKTHAIILDHAGNLMRHGLPDDDREWSLKGRKERSKSTGGGEPVRQCPKCFATHSPAPRCRECGHVYEIEARELKEIEGELEEVDVHALRRERQREQAQAKSLQDLIQLATARGYKSPEKWAAHVYTARLDKARQQHL